MNIIASKDDLLEGLQRVANIVPQKPTLPVLSNVLLKASGNALSISGTDMDISIVTTVPCEVRESGAITVNAKRLLGIIRELPSGEVSITVDGEKVTIVFASGQSAVLGLPSSDFPSLRENIEGTSVALSGADFVEMVDKTAFSVSQDRTRLALTGIYWSITPDKMTMVSTDGHRLSLFGRNMQVDMTGTAEAIVPPKSMGQAAQIIDSGTELKRVVFGDGALFFDFGSTTIFSKVIEGPYPNFRQVIPTANSKKVYAVTDDLAASVRRVSVLSNSITHQVRLSVSPGAMKLSTRNEDIGGESHETIPVRYDGDEMTAGYNANFLSELLRKIDTDEVLLELETSTTACIVKPVGSAESDEYIYLIMPLRLNE